MTSSVLINNNNRSLFYLSTASRMKAIQVMRSSLEPVWISYISGRVELPTLMRNMALSSWATSLTIRPWSEMTDGLLSCRDQQRGVNTVV